MQMGAGSSAADITPDLSAGDGMATVSLSPRSKRDPSPAELGLLRSQSSTSKQVCKLLMHCQESHSNAQCSALGIVGVIQQSKQEP